MFRRKFVKAAGATMVGGLLAGCSGSSGGSTETGTGSATGTETTDGMGEGTTEGSGTGTGSGDALDIDGEILEDSPPGLEVTDRELYQNASAVGFRGTVSNTGDVPYENVQVQVTLQDDQGEVLYEFIDEAETEATQTLAPDSEWEFDVVFEEANMAEVANYTIELDGDRAESPGDETVSDGTGTAMNETMTTESS
ncbi:FxLYD domain-containing protein [Halogeometricum luteum]|uniref:DUF3426 domain-containing protein n=1 Tax=Halogeometricum luteum TaxID=2950537 RepID=A0ABU2G5H7_9EURY|nr:FxLYD domain-containing protein [Halogeometricum sp. S3BR5-2]MDS0296047.1 DUF3426 domain-containing protein [Halogeometricum sp. S3BR5-2]